LSLGAFRGTARLAKADALLRPGVSDRAWFEIDEIRGVAAQKHVERFCDAIPTPGRRDRARPPDSELRDMFGTFASCGPGKKDARKTRTRPRFPPAERETPKRHGQFRRQLQKRRRIYPVRQLSSDDGTGNILAAIISRPACGSRWKFTPSPGSWRPSCSAAASPHTAIWHPPREKRVRKSRRQRPNKDARYAETV